MRMVIKDQYLLDAMSAVESTDQDEAVMMLRDDRWFISCTSPAQVVSAAVRVPKKAMDEYERRDYEEIGIRIDDIRDFTGASDQEKVELEMDQRTLHMRSGDLHARLSTIVPDSVHGTLRTSPDINYEVVVEGDISIVEDFANRGPNVAGSSNFMIGCREDGMYLYTRGDNGSIDKKVEWSAFDNVEIDWSVNNKPPGGGLIPKDDKGCDVILDPEWFKSLSKIEDRGEIHIGNHMPLKMVFHKTEEKVKTMSVSYLQSPRIDEGDEATVPESVTGNQNS